ncbi:MAG: ATP-binding protein, partial [Bifidobacteriaceae bacterium]|nr:ATP-binding protein [Bifidobacteriaceae bacterium]
MIPRPETLERLIRYRDTEHLVKVVSGVRRCGKSTLLDMFRDHLMASGIAPASVLALNFERFELAGIDSAEKLDALVAGHAFPEGRRYILLDEVQLVPGWERVVNSLRLEPSNDVYITGSNTRLLGTKLATLLSGRYVTIDVLPLSFAEYLVARPADGEAGRRQRFSEYLTTGGLPGLLNLPEDDRVRREYLDGVLSTILMKDVIQVHQVRDADALWKITRYLGANIGNQVTVAGIAHYFASSGRR